MRGSCRRAKSNRRRALYGLGVTTLLEALPLWVRSHRLGGRSSCAAGRVTSSPLSGSPVYR